MQTTSHRASGPRFRIPALMALLVAIPLAVPLDGQMATPGQAATPPDTEELTTFAETYVDIQEIRADVERQMALVTEQEEAARLQQEANERMAGALENNDVTIERYTEITDILNGDEALREEFQELYQEILEERGTTPPPV